MNDLLIRGRVLTFVKNPESIDDAAPTGTSGRRRFREDGKIEGVGLTAT